MERGTAKRTNTTAAKRFITVDKINTITFIQSRDWQHYEVVMDKIKLVEARQYKKDIPEFKTGDTLTVHVRVVEGDKERIQQFQGIVIGKRGEGMGATFRIRKISDGVGVERVFPIHSPRIAKIERVKEGSVRRSKLYYLRGLAAKEIRQKTGANQ